MRKKDGLGELLYRMPADCYDDGHYTVQTYEAVYVCSYCWGCGYHEDKDDEPCEICDGTGRITMLEGGWW